MFIMTEDMPSPEAMKFLPGIPLLPESFTTSIELDKDQDTATIPLATTLFKVNGVERVILAHDFIVISKSPDAKWTTLKPRLLAAIMDHLKANRPVIVDDGELANNDIDRRICAVIDKYIRPLLQRDGGDIAYCGFDDGYVTVKLKGACSGCPHAAMTLKNGVERLLKEHIPEVCAVIPDKFA